ncbi:MAG TPA: M23 family metallopeptidase [Pseudomonadales bacterium]
MAVLFLLLAGQLAAEPVRLQGELVQGAMIVGHAPAGSQIRLNDTVLRQSAAGYFVFGLDRDAEPGQLLQVDLPDGRQWQQQLRIKARDYRLQHVTGVDDRLVSPEKPPETWQRIREESAQIREARAGHVELEAFRQAFRWPIIGPVTGVFGSQRVYNGRPGRPHYGVDVAAPVGAQVNAPADGLVTLVHDNMYYSGGTLIIDHGYGISSSFLHLSDILVKPGERVSQGQPVARVGSSGISSGPHLDWRMNWYTQRIDPQTLVPDMATLLKTSTRDTTDD